MKASECKCIVCGKPAVAFWPMIDPDIPEHPYCRKCLDEAKRELLIEILKSCHKNEKSNESTSKTANTKHDR